MRVHLEDRPYKCTHCPYASKTRNNLILHIRTHKALAPLECPHCDFRGEFRPYLGSIFSKEDSFFLNHGLSPICYIDQYHKNLTYLRLKPGLRLVRFLECLLAVAYCPHTSMTRKKQVCVSTKLCDSTIVMYKTPQFHDFSNI